MRMELEITNKEMFPVLQDKSKESYVSAYDLYVELGLTRRISEWLDSILSSKWIVD